MTMKIKLVIIGICLATTLMIPVANKNINAYHPCPPGDPGCLV